jgi:hypothetical protein
MALRTGGQSALPVLLLSFALAMELEKGGVVLQRVMLSSCKRGTSHMDITSSEFGQRLLVTIWFYCVSGFATSVVNCGTTRVPKGLPM